MPPAKKARLPELSTSSALCTIISSDKVKFPISKNLLRVNCLFFEDLFESADGDDDELPITETSEEIKLFLETIQGKVQEEYAYKEAVILATMGDKYDSWLARYVARRYLKKRVYTYPLEIFCLAIKIGDDQLGNQAARSSLDINLSKLNDAQLEIYSTIDIAYRNKLENYHLKNQLASHEFLARDFNPIYKKDCTARVGNRHLASLEFLKFAHTSRQLLNSTPELNVPDEFAYHFKTVKGRLSACLDCMRVFDEFDLYLEGKWETKIDSVKLPL